jgi:hypothetical protein
MELPDYTPKHDDLIYDVGLHKVRMQNFICAKASALSHLKLTRN